jgi:UDP-N-acetylglucosamine 1-carboxyvinyltransferase
MSKFLIQGGKPLKGKIKPMGCKNAALPIIAATLLTKEPCIIDNIPEISDVKVLLELIENLGVSVTKIKPHQYKIQAQKLRLKELKSQLAQKLRASILLLGPILAREGELKMLHPGGCIIGKRPVGTHFQALEKMGATITQDQNYYYASAKKGLKATHIFLDEPSPTATENVIMAAALTPGKTIIRDAACEPHVQDLCEFLEKMGVKFKGLGTQILEIWGRDKLTGANHTVMPDNIEVGTFVAMTAATQGNVIIEDVNIAHLDPIFHQMDLINIKYEIGPNYLHIKPNKNLKSSRIQPRPWPGFPTDLQAPFTVLATQAKGTSLIHEWMYEGRLFYIDELIKMGAEIILCDPHRALVTGPTKLNGSKIVSPDIRAGVALIIAALTADGESEIDNIELIDRGYEDIENRLKKIGAKIRRI